MNPLIGQELKGRYRVESALGRGGMAEVYKVWDKQRTTYLALKLLREDLAQDRIFLRRFKREAQTLAKLQHPNIVRFYGLEHDGYNTFMLMDFIEGKTLREEIFGLDGTPMQFDQMLPIIQQLCSALHYAHEEGVVHCDLKPGNVMIHMNGTIQVTDFGIARMMDAATATMVGLGTPAYMAPELVRGHAPTSASDIYSLGIILFEMVTGGERPFTGERATITGSTSEKVRWEQMNLNPPSPRRWNASIPDELVSVVQRAMDKDPSRRFSSASEMLSAVAQRFRGARDIIGSSPRAGSQSQRESVNLGIEDQQSLLSKDQAHRIAGRERSHPSRTPTWLWGIVGAAIVLSAISLYTVLSNSRNGNAPVVVIITDASPNEDSGNDSDGTSSDEGLVPGDLESKSKTETAIATLMTVEPEAPTLEPTPTYTLTPTPIPGRLKVEINSACRFGPGTIYDVIGYLVPGEEALIEGTDLYNDWWWIEKPDGSKYCWIADSVVSISGYLDQVPVLTPAPTNTPIPIPTVVLPDLVCRDIENSWKIGANKTVSIGISIANRGPGESPSSVAHLRIEGPGSFGQKDYNINFPPLPPTDIGYVIYKDITFGDAGGYFFECWADYPNGVVETKEENNYRYKTESAN